MYNFFESADKKVKGSAIVLAGIAIALWIKRGEILFVFVAADIDSAFTGH